MWVGFFPRCCGFNIVQNWKDILKNTCITAEKQNHFVPMAATFQTC